MDNNVLSGLVVLALISLTEQELNPGCECLIYSATYGKEYGRFSTPDFPMPYPDDTSCLLYTFIAGSSEVVEIEITKFDLHSHSSDCSSGDYLRVYLELENAHLTDLTPSSGVLCSALPTSPLLLYSSGPYLVLEFHTLPRPRNANNSGFMGTFRFIDTTRYTMLGGDYGGCDYQIVETAPSGTIYSPRYPSSYPRNSRCSYSLRARKLGRVRISFKEFELQRGDHSCLTHEDVIRFYDGPGPIAPVITILCNQVPNFDIISTSESLYLEFIAKSHWPGRGFRANYFFLPPSEFYYEEMKLGPAVSATRSSCDVKLTSEASVNGSITSPGFPGPYPPRSTCQYEFLASGRQRVQLIFTDFSLFMGSQKTKDCEGADSVVAYVILDERVEKIDSYCGVNVPQPIMSNGPRLSITFHGIHSSRHARGFRAKYHFTNSFGITGGEQVEDYPCGFMYRAKVARSGSFWSPNYPGLYPRETECHYFFHGEAHHRVQIVFHYFDVEGVSPCDVTSASDYVEFSNFMGLDRKYTRQCGRIVSGLAVESEKKFFRVTFRTNDRLDATGFNATYEFIETPTTPPTTTEPNAALRYAASYLVIILAFCSATVVQWR